MKESWLAEALYVKAPFQPIMKSARPCRRWRGGWVWGAWKAKQGKGPSR